MKTRRLPQTLDASDLMLRARGERHLTQAEAATELQVTIKTVQNWESGRSYPNALHRRKLVEWATSADAEAAA